jgi:hypothetical protein
MINDKLIYSIQFISNAANWYSINALASLRSALWQSQIRSTFLSLLSILIVDVFFLGASM